MSTVAHIRLIRESSYMLLYAGETSNLLVTIIPIILWGSTDILVILSRCPVLIVPVPTRKPRDTALNSDTYRILQRHSAVSLSQHSFLVHISDVHTEYTDFHGRDSKSRR